MCTIYYKYYVWSDMDVHAHSHLLCQKNNDSYGGSVVQCRNVIFSVYNFICTVDQRYMSNMNKHLKVSLILALYVTKGLVHKFPYGLAHRSDLKLVRVFLNYFPKIHGTKIYNCTTCRPDERAFYLLIHTYKIHILYTLSIFFLI